MEIIELSFPPKKKKLGTVPDKRYYKIKYTKFKKIIGVDSNGSEIITLRNDRSPKLSIFEPPMEQEPIG